MYSGKSLFKARALLGKSLFRGCALLGQSPFQACALLGQSPFQACALLGQCLFQACILLGQALFQACGLLGKPLFQACILLTESCIEHFSEVIPGEKILCVETERLGHKLRLHICLGFRNARFSEPSGVTERVKRHRCHGSPLTFLCNMPVIGV